MRQVKVIAILTALLFLLPAIGFTLYRVVRDHFVTRMLDEKYHIDTIVQTGLVKDALPTIYLAELLGLSCDQPTNFFTFDSLAATQKLLSSPLIKEAKIEKRKPSTIYIDYQIRTPVAILRDFTNVAIDNEGYTFAMAPFYSPTKLPEIFLDLKELTPKIEGEKIELAFSIYKLLEEVDLQGARLVKIDVSRAFHESYGKREVVLTMEHFNQTHLLRMSAKDFKTELRNYLSVKDKMGDTRTEKGTKVLDLRIAKLAFIESIIDE